MMVAAIENNTDVSKLFIFFIDLLYHIYKKYIIIPFVYNTIIFVCAGRSKRIYFIQGFFCSVPGRYTSQFRQAYFGLFIRFWREKLNIVCVFGMKWIKTQITIKASPWINKHVLIVKSTVPFSDIRRTYSSRC